MLGTGYRVLSTGTGHSPGSGGCRSRQLSTTNPSTATGPILSRSAAQLGEAHSLGTHPHAQSTHHLLGHPLPAIASGHRLLPITYPQHLSPTWAPMVHCLPSYPSTAFPGTQCPPQHPGPPMAPIAYLGPHCLLQYPLPALVPTALLLTWAHIASPAPTTHCLPGHSLPVPASTPCSGTHHLPWHPSFHYPAGHPQPVPAPCSGTHYFLWHPLSLYPPPSAVPITMSTLYHTTCPGTHLPQHPLPAPGASSISLGTLQFITHPLPWHPAPWRHPPGSSGSEVKLVAAGRDVGTPTPL